MKKNNIEHYDVMEFESLPEMNAWILNQVQQSRPKLKPLKKYYLSVTKGSGQCRNIGTLELNEIADTPIFRRSLTKAINAHMDDSISLPDKIAIDDVLIGKNVAFVVSSGDSDNACDISICQTWLY